MNNINISPWPDISALRFTEYGTRDECPCCAAWMGLCSWHQGWARWLRPRNHRSSWRWVGGDLQPLWGVHKGGYPNSWMVSRENPIVRNDDLGPLWMETPIYGWLTHDKWNISHSYVSLLEASDCNERKHVIGWWMCRIITVLISLPPRDFCSTASAWSLEDVHQ